MLEYFHGLLLHVFIYAVRYNHASKQLLGTQTLPPCLVTRFEPLRVTHITPAHMDIISFSREMITL